MLKFLKNIFGAKPKVDYRELLNSGAQIIDVRTPPEFKSGHIKGAVNMPLNTLGSHLSKLKKDKAIITCCASGMRSGAAKNILRSKGFAEVYNGGGWMSLKNKLNR